MTDEHKLSPFAATLINVNVMLGSGIFLNITELAKRTGMLGFVCYALVGILLLPLVASIATLLRLYPSGGFYAFSANNLGPFFGFASTWSYFVGKLGSATIMIHASVLILQQLIPLLAQAPYLSLDIAILSLFIALNLLNMKTGTVIQGCFTTLKLLPILFVITVCFFYFNPVNVAVDKQLWEGIPLSLPLVVYALIGFEVACSLSNHIKNSRHNAPRVIFISYGIALLCIILFQFLFYGTVGPSLALHSSFQDAYPTLFTFLLPYWPSVAYYGSSFCNFAIAFSALGGAYSILFSNSWNLYTLARYDYILHAPWFTRMNKHNIPFMCIIAEGVVCLMYLLVSQGKQIVLQQLGVLGVITSLSLSVLSLLIASRRKTEEPIASWIPLLGLVTCTILICACIRGLMIAGPAALISFIMLVAIGCTMFIYKTKRTAT